MPDKEELEQMLESQEHLDAWEISRLHQMEDAAKLMDERDAASDYAMGGADGD